MNKGSGNLTRPCCIVCDCHGTMYPLVAHNHSYVCHKRIATDGHAGTMNNGSMYEAADMHQKHRTTGSCIVAV